jgi:hypothetical protein
VVVIYVLPLVGCASEGFVFVSVGRDGVMSVGITRFGVRANYLGLFSPVPLNEMRTRSLLLLDVDVNVDVSVPVFDVQGSCAVNG